MTRATLDTKNQSPTPKSSSTMREKDSNPKRDPRGSLKATVNPEVMVKLEEEAEVEEEEVVEAAVVEEVPEMVMTDRTISERRPRVKSPKVSKEIEDLETEDPDLLVRTDPPRKRVKLKLDLQELITRREEKAERDPSVSTMTETLTRSQREKIEKIGKTDPPERRESSYVTTAVKKAA